MRLLFLYTLVDSNFIINIHTMKKSIRVIVNPVYEGWTAKDLETGIGGSEEKLIEWARELAKDYSITIYHNGVHGNFNKVKYRDYREFNALEYSDVFISFKSRNMLLQSINAGKKFHWTTDIEDWSDLRIQDVDKIFVISDWHASQMKSNKIPMEKLYLWADLKRLDKNKVKKEKGTMLYCTSYDRGLEGLLRNWGTIMKKLELNKLYITYGWDFLDRMIRGNPPKEVWKKNMLELMKQDGIKVLGRLSNNQMCKYYWKSEYWCLPCNNANAELFCINAVKAQYTNCIPLVRRIGGLQETVNEFMDFDRLIGQKVGKDTFKKGSFKRNRRYVIDNFSMDKQIEKWKKILG